MSFHHDTIQRERPRMPNDYARDTQSKRPCRRLRLRKQKLNTAKADLLLTASYPLFESHITMIRPTPKLLLWVLIALARKDPSYSS